MSTPQQTFEIYPIGTVRRAKDSVELRVDPPYRAALKALDGFSHVMVFWWAGRFGTPEYRRMLTCNPPYAPDHLTGIFASRSPVRPNPVMMTTCRLLAVDEAQGIVRVADLDAFEGTPLVDLKAYFPVCDRVRQAHIPPWLEGWPEWMPEDGNGLEEYES